MKFGETHEQNHMVPDIAKIVRHTKIACKTLGVSAPSIFAVNEIIITSGADTIAFAAALAAAVKNGFDLDTIYEEYYLGEPSTLERFVEEFNILLKVGDNLVLKKSPSRFIDKTIVDQMRDALRAVLERI